jgi:hypothetical protein
MKRCAALLVVALSCAKHPPSPTPPDSAGLSDNASDPALAVIGTCSLASSGGLFLVAEGGGGGAVDANRDAIGPWETFQIEVLDPGALSDGSRVHFRTFDGHYLGADGGGGHGLSATRDVAGSWETFTLHKLAGSGAIVRGDAISVQTVNGNYVTAEGGGGGIANANRVAVGPWETWTFDGAGGAPLVGSLQTIAGNYVTAEGGGGDIVVANRTAIGPWEMFTFDLLDGTFADGAHVRIRANNGEFFRAGSRGGSWLRADSSTAGTWETFRLHRLNGGGAAQVINDSDTLALETDNGHYVVAEGGGGDVVNADRTMIGPWETFTFVGTGGAFPAPPSRDAVINVRADFGNLRDAKDRPMFTPFLLSLMDDCAGGDSGACADVEDWIARLKAEGDTHVALNISYDYGENLGWAPRYPIHGLDLTKRVPTLRAYLEKLIRRGFIPILFLSCDGHASDPNGGYNDPIGWSYGLPWCEAHLGDIINQLRSGRDLAPYILWSSGWDGCFPDWSPQQTNDFFTLLRAQVGPAGNLATEFGNGYIHMGGGGNDWYQPGLAEVDVFFIEFGTNVLDPNEQCGVQQVAARMLGPDKTFSPGPPCDSTSPPFYLGAPRSPRGPLSVVAWEYAAYTATRKQIDPETARRQGDYLYSLGFRRLGNGQAHGH